MKNSKQRRTADPIIVTLKLSRKRIKKMGKLSKKVQEGIRKNLGWS